MKYRVEVSSHVTRFCSRTIPVYADNETEAADKAIDKFIELESLIAGSVDSGSPNVDGVELLTVK